MSNSTLSFKQQGWSSLVPAVVTKAPELPAILHAGMGGIQCHKLTPHWEIYNLEQSRQAPVIPHNQKAASLGRIIRCEAYSMALNLEKQLTFVSTASSVHKCLHGKSTLLTSGLTYSVRCIPQ